MLSLPRASYCMCCYSRCLFLKTLLPQDKVNKLLLLANSQISEKGRKDRNYLDVQEMLSLDKSAHIFIHFKASSIINYALIYYLPKNWFKKQRFLRFPLQLYSLTQHCLHLLRCCRYSPSICLFVHVFKTLSFFVCIHGNECIVHSL